MEFFARCITVIATNRGKFDDVAKLSREELLEAWEKVERTLDYLANIMLQHAYVDSTEFLTTLYPFFPLVYYLANNNFTFSDPKMRDKFLYWFYSSLIWGRYSGSSETSLDQDIRILKETNSVDELIQTIALLRGGNLSVTDKDLELQGTRSRFYQLIYVVIRSNGAADWADASLSLYHKNLGRSYTIEKHHIFPKSKLYKIYDSSRSYDKQLVNELGNIAFLTSATNHSIFDNDPDVYLPNLDKEQLRRQYIPLDLTLWKMKHDSFEGFLKERRRLLAEGINSFLHKLYAGTTSIHVVVDSDIWRARVEEIELALRDIIVKIYNENEEDISWSYIPTHISPKIKERIEKYLRDNPAENKNDFMLIEKQVSFFDVSEYHALIVSKDNWRYFETIFGDKHSLEQRFSQLQNLRNTLAHHRELNDVIVKDGEAAILWFSSALRRFD